MRRTEGRGLAAGSAGTRPYTPAMRRWVCIIGLLAGFAGNGYVWTARPRLPVPIERSLDRSPARRGTVPTGVWWQVS